MHIPIYLYMLICLYIYIDVCICSLAAIRSVALGGVPHDTYGMTTSSVLGSVGCSTSAPPMCEPLHQIDSAAQGPFPHQHHAFSFLGQITSTA